MKIIILSIGKENDNEYNFNKAKQSYQKLAIGNGWIN